MHHAAKHQREQRAEGTTCCRAISLACTTPPSISESSVQNYMCSRAVHAEGTACSRAINQLMHAPQPPSISESSVKCRSPWHRHQHQPLARSAKGAHDAHAARVVVAPRRTWLLLLEETVDGGKFDVIATIARVCRCSWIFYLLTKSPAVIWHALLQRIHLLLSTTRAVCCQAVAAMRGLSKKASVVPKKARGEEIEGLTEGTIDDLREAFGLFDKVCRQPTHHSARRPSPSLPWLRRRTHTHLDTRTRTRARRRMATAQSPSKSSARSCLPSVISRLRKISRR